MVKRLLLLTILVVSSLLTAAYSAEYDYAKLSETLLNQDPDPAVPGEYVEIRFKVEKEGNEPLEDISYELIAEHPFSFDSSDSAVKELGSWEGLSDDKEYYILYYKLKVDEDALEDTYELTLYQSSANTDAKRKIDFDIRVGEKDNPKLIYGKARTTPQELIANFDDAKLSLEIVNIGDGVADEVIVELELPEESFGESFGYSNRATLGSINAGSSKEAIFYIDTKKGLRQGSYDTTLKITYKDPQEDSQSDELKTIELPFSIQIFGRPEYELTSTNISKLRPGSKGEIELEISNIGSKESDSTSIQIFKDSSDPFEFEDKSVFIGKVDVNEKGEAVFRFDVDDDAIPKEYRMDLQVRSVVGDDVLVEDKVLVLDVEKRKAEPIGENIYARIMLYIAFFIAGLFIGTKLKKKKQARGKNK